jgi:nitroreductase/NAD-dependent dihydropyrimidine dehydrogenase PreA subunit
MTTVFDRSKCVQCKICTEICPTGVIAVNDGGYPMIAPANAEDCVTCGHCEAVCPQGAVTVTAPTLSAALFSGEEPAITPEQMGSYIMRRRSIRVYEQKPVPRKTLEAVLDAVRYAPSAVNGQPVRWIIVHETARVKTLARMVVAWMRAMVGQKAPLAAAFGFAELVSAYDNGYDPICRNAPHLAVTCAHKDNPMGVGDSVIALTTFDLAAPAFGFGTCWAGFFKMAAAASPQIQKELGIPDDHVFTGALMVGFPKYQYVGIPKRNKMAIIWK